MERMNFDEVKSRVNLLDLAEEAGANFRKSGRVWRSRCPIHGGDNDSAFVVYEENGGQKWKCFTANCGQGDIFDFVRKLHGVDLETAYQILGGEENPDLETIARSAIERAERAERALQEQIDRAQKAIDELRRARVWLRYHEILRESQEARNLWIRRGIVPAWQDFWKLGYCDAFNVYRDRRLIGTSPSLTIPVHDKGWEVVNVRHRLLRPPADGEKYRPERAGLDARAFIANPNIGFDSERIFVVEGEIKSMVTYETIYTREEDTPQVIGIPGKTVFSAIEDRLRGRDVYLCFDPDAKDKVIEAAKKIGGAKVISLPMKIDDAILAGVLDRKSIEWRMKTARRV